uniref:DUF3488 domain-containing protein n=1 Tax=Gongylonema pulchrum TaxID=637853 RepID=A0A183E7T6_9BILA
LQELAEKRRKPETVKSYKTVISRSPFELDLVEPILLENYSFKNTQDWHQLQSLNADTLHSAIKENKITFVYFWNNESTVSQYVFYLWAEASKTLVPRYPDAAFGALACHELGELCEDYVTSASEQRTIFAFSDNAVHAKTSGLRDPKYYIDWVHL